MFNQSNILRFTGVREEEKMHVGGWIKPASFSCLVFSFQQHIRVWSSD
jgi:hypothetical protein